MKQALYADSAIEATEVSVGEADIKESLTRSLPPRASRPQPGSFVVRKSTRTRTPRVATNVSTRLTTTVKQKAAPKPETVRHRVRNEIATKTKPKRDAFLYHHRVLFQPLLPASNYITKLNPAHMQNLQPHIEIKHQPAKSVLAQALHYGCKLTIDSITATLKPHQLVGLEFLVNMHMNGVSAVLGDEMGLGKTCRSTHISSSSTTDH